MVWHFFKKDFRLLWPTALALAAAQALCAVRTSVLGHFQEPLALYQLTRALPVLVCLGVALVTIVAVHQDALPGVRQDWLTRPVRRRDVWLSKVLFVLLLVVMPFFAIDVLEELSVQLPLTMSIAGAASRSFMLIGILVLPALTLGAVTRSFTEALILGIVATVAISTLVMLGLAAFPPEMLFGVPSGTQWIQFACALLVMAVAAAVTLWFQHSYRRTGLARAIAIVGALMTNAVLAALPASAAMGIQRWTWGHAVEDAVALHFAPDSQTTSNKSGERLSLQDEPNSRDPASAAARQALAQAQNTQYAKLVIPLRIEGMAPRHILRTDQLSVRITAADGAVYFDGGRICLRSGAIGASCRLNGLEIRTDKSGAPDSFATAQVGLPTALYQRIKDQAVTLQLDFSLTSFEPDPAQLMGTNSSVHQVSQLGSCATRIDADEDEVELRCLTSAKVPSCVVAVLEDPQTEKHNPELYGCLPDYAPFPMYPSSLDVVRQVGMSLPFHDPSGLAQFPVDSPAIGRAQIRLTTFTPVSHFQRSLSIPNVRLADWEASRVLKPGAQAGN